MTDFDAAARLAGFFMAHAIWCVSGGPLIPFVAQEGPSGRTMNRYVAPRLEDGVREGRSLLDSNPEGASRAMLVYDAFVTIEGQRRDALMGTVIDFGPPRRLLEIVVPYRPPQAPGGFAVHRPKFNRAEGLEQEALQTLGPRFFEGVDSHEKGTEVWSRYMDQSV